MIEKINLTLTIPEEFSSMRLDQALAKLLPDYSRTQIQDWIKNNKILVNQHPLKARDKVRGGEQVTVTAQPKIQPSWEAQAISLSIVYEDESILVINKPIGMVVHAAAGNLNNTLLNALLYHTPKLKDLPRAGIIHRLDKDTSGLLVIAKTPIALKKLSAQLKKHSMIRIYQAIILGVMTSGGTVNAPIGRHPVQRKRMAVQESGKPAVTHYRIIEKYRAHTRVKIQLETGRTHQIRVHMAHIHYPVLGDQTYNKRLQIPKGANPELVTKLREFKRQALHACELSLVHPVTEKPLTWQIPLPEDMQELVRVLQQDAKKYL